MSHKKRNYSVCSTLCYQMMNCKVIPVGTDTGWYFVVLGQCKLVLLGTWWYSRVSIELSSQEKEKQENIWRGNIFSLQKDQEENLQEKENNTMNGRTDRQAESRQCYDSEVRIAKDCLLTGQEQACSWITWLVVCLFVRSSPCRKQPIHRKMVVDCPLLIISKVKPRQQASLLHS